MEGETDARNLIVKQVLPAKPINVQGMEGETDARNLIVKQVHKAKPAKPINVQGMEAETDVRIVLLGLIVVVVQLLTTTIVPHVSNEYFQTMTAVKLYIRIPKK